MERMCLGLALYLLGSTASMAMNIVTIEQPEYRKVLKSKAQEVQFPLSQEDKKLIAAMKTKLNGLGGVGLAAPQVNCAKR